MFSPPELDVANGCESKLSLTETNTPGQMELLTHDGRSRRLVCPVGERIQEPSKEAKLGGRRRPTRL